ncbi:MAG TPA: tetratricopeptide repeat protein, partial [Phycisphaerales bacterium]|nr:tetratricopeptide repeat protein [Phycisphaerales bacterium]
YYYLAQAYKYQARIDDAIHALEQAIRIAPDAFNAHDDLADLLHQVGRDEESKTHADIAARLRAEMEARIHSHDHPAAP